MTQGVKGTAKDFFTLPPTVVLADLAPPKNLPIVQILRPHFRLVKSETNSKAKMSVL